MAHAIGFEVHRSHSTGFFRNLLEGAVEKITDLSRGAASYYLWRGAC